jgi:predicted O-linked N-acetylglucosamine transferase (SPINDLY family)
MMPVEKHLKRIQLADLFLDTFPYNAHTTASDALRVGLPILTLMGESFASRVAASLLNAVGLSKLITKNRRDYESLAVELASYPEKLQAIKNKLLVNVPTSSLFNSKLFTKNLESAYRTIYERYQNELTPDHIFISNE